MSRRGPWTRHEKDFIGKHYDIISSDEIAKHLDRDPRGVYKYIKEVYGSHYQENAKQAEASIKTSPIWKDIKAQFTPEEQEMFIYQWGRIISQFKDDVYPTEELQVIDTIKLDILMNRALTEQQKCVTRISQLERLIDKERELDKETRDMDFIHNLERQVQFLRAAQDSCNSDYKEMLQRKGNILKEMKATREARIKNIESSKQTFGTWLRQLIENKALRIKLGQEMEKIRLASQKEYERISQHHTYINGEVEQPLLTPENTE